MERSTVAKPAGAPGPTTRTRVLSSLAARGAPTRADKLAEALGLHPNTVRLHLERLERARLVRRRTAERRGPGRPHIEWTAAPGALPASSAYRALAGWLVQGLLDSSASPLGLRRTGRSIGREMASSEHGPDAIEAVEELLRGLGFEPQRTEEGSFRLRTCPFGGVAEEGSALVCSLHHGIVEGFLEIVDPDWQVGAFEPRPPAEAGCVVSLRRTSGRRRDGE